MNSEFWARVIKDYFEKELPHTIKREYVIPLENPINRSITLTGGRRTGKTFEIYNIIKKILKNNKKEQTLYINFERSDILPTIEDLNTIKKIYFEIVPENKKTWFFLDEIQNVKNWENFVRQCLDENINIFLTGSSSKLLSKEIATSMRGRNLTYSIYPFSFKEYLNAKEIQTKKYYSTKEINKIKKALQEYLLYGGYPETIIYPEQKEKLLIEILNTTIYKDVAEREKIRNIKALKLTMNALINSTEFSTHKYYNFLKTQGIKLSKNTIYNYIEYLKDANIIYTNHKNEHSYKKAEQSIPKIYLIDNGILTINNIEDKGRLLENMIFIELKRRNHKISYYKTQTEEIDFVIQKGKKITELIQSSISIEQLNTKEREIKALIKASKELKCNKLTIINLNQEETIKEQGKTIKVKPAWKWLLEE
ncbi:MAG: ATP-binding protein [Candidatus ainarchaeum sp.]|nr:ATP-binding protein [Candidatus ainarchaeum sp.]